MTTTGKRLQDYRATTALKDTRDAQYDEHLVNKILSPLNALASKDLAYGDPQSHSDPLDVRHVRQSRRTMLIFFPGS